MATEAVGIPRARLYPTNHAEDMALAVADILHTLPKLAHCAKHATLAADGARLPNHVGADFHVGYAVAILFDRGSLLHGQMTAAVAVEEVHCLCVAHCRGEPLLVKKTCSCNDLLTQTSACNAK